MLSSNEIKRIKSLAQKKFRDESGLFVVEGEKMVDEALRSDFTVESLWRREDIGDTAMSRISMLSSPSPVLAVVRKPSWASCENIRSERPAHGLYLGLDSLRDPGNLGTILRIADWFGISAVYATQDTVDVFNPKVVQSTMGAIFRVRIHYTDLPAAASSFLEAGGRVYGTFLDGEDIYCRDLDAGDKSPVMVVIGNEADGISPQMEKMVSDRLYIPPFPAGRHGSESLNAAVATAVAVSEFRRRLH